MLTANINLEVFASACPVDMFAFHQLNHHQKHSKSRHNMNNVSDDEKDNATTITSHSHSISPNSSVLLDDNDDSNDNTDGNSSDSTAIYGKEITILMTVRVWNLESFCRCH